MAPHKKNIYTVFALSCIFFISHQANGFTFTSNKLHGILQDAFLQELIDTFKPTIFFETGTFDGRNAVNVARYLDVYTVELSKILYREAQQRTAPHENIKLYNGSSPETIAKIAPQLDGRILFWLDAHFSGGDTALSNDDISDPESVTAIRKELATIKQLGITDCVILIDDVRGFGSAINGKEFLGCWAYPTIQEVCAMGKEINPDFSFALLGDMLLMYDSIRFNPRFSNIVKACTESRLYDGSNITDQALQAHEEIIMHADGAEKAFIKDLYKRMTDYKDPVFHHDLWYALVSMGEKNWNEALHAIEKVPNRAEHLNKRKERVQIPIRYTHYRIDEYKKHILMNQ